ncbi:MAG: hypothetical protein ABSH50_02370 [Bryobacteraceae bacterium]|jgi:hypothetical protein
MYAIWHRLASTAICGMGILWAGVCETLPPAPPHGADVPESVHVMSFRLAAKPDGPVFRITVRSSSAKPLDGDSPVHAGDIEVARCQDGKTIQSLPILSRQPIDFVRAFHAQDVNFDGYLDFAVLVERAGAWGSEQWWVYDPSSGRFVNNPLTQDLRALQAGEFEIDPEKQVIGARQLTEPWGCGSTVDRYRVVNHRLLLIHMEAPEAQDNRCRVVVSDLADGVMHITEVRQFADGQRLK